MRKTRIKISLRVRLSRAPTTRALIGAVHQGEGLIIRTIWGKEFSFLPKDGSISQGIKGDCWRIERGQFTKEWCSALLKIENVDTPKAKAYLTLHT